MQTVTANTERELEVWGAVALHLDQVENLSRALQNALEAELAGPVQGNIPGALALAVLRATEDAKSAFEARYHPGSI
ncbi:MAG: hypothetical protein AAFZ99_06660 [Pseudomonadota bacterium]